MSIRKKIEDGDLTNSFTKKIESTLFDLLDDDDPVNIYMLTDICRQLGLELNHHFPLMYVSGKYNLTHISQGNFNKVLEVTEALYDTCLRFQKYDLAIIVSNEVNRALKDSGLPMAWSDGKFHDW